MFLADFEISFSNKYVFPKRTFRFSDSKFSHKVLKFAEGFLFRFRYVIFVYVCNLENIIFYKKPVYKQESTDGKLPNNFQGSTLFH